MKIKNNNTIQTDNVIMLPLKLGGPNAPRVDTSVLRMIGSTNDQEISKPEPSENVFAN